MARSKTQTTTPVNDSVTPVAATPKSKKSTKTTDGAPASKKASKTTATPVAATPVAATPVAAAPVAATPVATSVDEVDASASVADGVTLSLTGDFTAFLARLQQATSMMSSLRSEFRILERKATRELRVAHKLNSKRKRKAGNRNPSGFVKPTLISDELAAFLGKDSGSEMARTEVTREINAYIREHKLQDTQNGRKINADDKLSGLLKLQSGDELTYFNLQKYMSPHFAKTVKPVATA
jgi:chromatin remodeling complex protein RSC6